MHQSEIYNLLRLPQAQTAEGTLRKAWLAFQPRPCKDVVALALPLRQVPMTQDGFRQAIAEGGKGGDWLLTSWYIVYVGAADGREWGWSQAPYDCKKRLPTAELKPLYSLDATSETRFWSFKKVSNNMNKGARIEEQEGEDLSFVLPAGTCFSQFLREDSYETKPLFSGDLGDGVLQAYQPVLLQLSSTNGEQASKGNGLKIRRVLPLAANVLHAFLDKFFSSKTELELAQQRARDTKALSAMARSMPRCPLVCHVSKNAFCFHDASAHVVEICEAGADSEMGCKLLLSESVLLQALLCTDISRALRMLTVALGHGAVTCLLVKQETGEDSTVLHLNIDMAETLWLGTLQKCKLVDHPTSLPCMDMLTMSVGPQLQTGTEDCLHWYSPSAKVLMMTESGAEVYKTFVFELEFKSTDCAAQREHGQKALFMDRNAGAHHVLRIFHADDVEFEEHQGMTCRNPTLFLCWQLWPGLCVELIGAAHATTRKRPLLTADDSDLLQNLTLQGSSAKRVRFVDSSCSRRGCDDSGHLGVGSTPTP